MLCAGSRRIGLNRRRISWKAGSLQIPSSAAWQIPRLVLCSCDGPQSCSHGPMMMKFGRASFPDAVLGSSAEGRMPPFLESK